MAEVIYAGDAGIFKVCSGCGEAKGRWDFHGARRESLGVAARCKACAAARNRAWRDENAESVAEKVAEWRTTNAEKNRAQTKVRTQRWKALNPDKDRAAHAASEQRRRSTPKVRLEQAMYVGLRSGLANGAKAGRSTFVILGYTADELRAHLEAQFQPGMTWSNYGRGGWHVDHVLPLASFNYTTPDCPDFKVAWSLKNLQPLWAAENITKRDRLDHPSTVAALAAQSRSLLAAA